MDAKPQKSIFAWEHVLLLVVVIIGGIYWVFPDRRIVLERMIESKEYNRAIETIQQLSPADIATDPHYYRITEIQCRYILTLEKNDPSTWEPMFVDTWKYYAELGGSSELQEILLKIVLSLKNPESAIEAVSTQQGKLAYTEILPVATALTKHALANELQSLAASFFLKTIVEPQPNYARLIELIELRRYANQPTMAVEDIMRIRQQLTLSSAEDYTLTLLHAGLLQSTNEVNKAFELILSLTQRMPERIKEDEFYAKIELLAMQSDRQKDLLPLLQQRLAVKPDDEPRFRHYLSLLMAEQKLKDVAELLDAHIKKGKALPDDLRMLAQLSEWEGKADKAFDIYLKLAQKNDRPALDRLLALNPGLFRHYELADVLNQWIPSENENYYRTYYARLLSTLGDYDSAVEQYETILKNTEAQTPQLYAEMADAAKTTYRFDTAIQAYQKSLALAPDAPDALKTQKQIAWLLTLDRKYEASLAAYITIFETQKQPNALPHILSLASMLGDTALYNSMLEKLITVNDGFADDVAIKLTANKNLEELAAWEVNMNQYRRALAQNYSEQKRFNEAIRILEKHTGLLTNADVFDLYLYLLTADKQFGKAMQVVESPKLNPSILENLSTMETIVWIYESNKRSDKAIEWMERIYNSNPNNQKTAISFARLLAANGLSARAQAIIEPILKDKPGTEFLRLAMDIALAGENYKEAERFLTLYINACETPSADDISFLADLKLARGDARGSQQTYYLALKAHLKSKTQLWE